jgi:hypothetical protein
VSSWPLPVTCAGSPGKLLPRSTSFRSHPDSPSTLRNRERLICTFGGWNTVIPRSALADERVVLVGDPVEAEHAGVPVDTVVGHDVVTALGVVVVVAGAADEDVGPAVRVVLEGERVVALDQVGTVVALEPVVTLVAGHDVTGGTAADQVVAGSSEVLRRVLVVQDEVVPGATEEQVEACTRVDRVVAVATVDDVVTEQVGDHVVTMATDEHVVALAALDVVGAVLAPDRVVADAAPDAVVGGRALDVDVVLTVEPGASR